MKRLKIFSATIFLLLWGLTSAQQKTIIINNALPDSVAKLVLPATGYRIFFLQSAYSDSLRLTINATSENFTDELSLQLNKKGYNTLIKGNHIFILKEKRHIL